jgi:TPR repeat protein
MSKFLLAVVIVLGFVALAYTPVAIGVDTRRAVAVAAVQADLAPIGASLLAPLAEAGDPLAQNDLGVMHMRGSGVVRDPAEAARLLNAAAASGLPRAQMNLLLLRASCDMSERTGTMHRLEEFARDGDRRAASFAADCVSWFTTPNSRVDGVRRLLAMAEIATSTSDPDEELKFGWLLMKTARELDGYGDSVEMLKQAAATAAASYLLRAAEHGRAAAYEGISHIAASQANLITDEALARRVSAKTAPEWIEVAAAAGHPRSRCAVGVKFATELAAKKTRASETERRKLAGLFQTCLKDRDPRQVIFKDGREQTLGHWPLADVWKMEEGFLITSPKYDNYDHDIAKRDDAVARIANLAKDL